MSHPLPTGHMPLLAAVLAALIAVTITAIKIGGNR